MGKLEESAEIPPGGPLAFRVLAAVPLKESGKDPERGIIVAGDDASWLADERLVLLSAERADGREVLQAELDEDPWRYLSGEHGAEKLPGDVDVAHQLSFQRISFWPAEV